jgi:hypothetical protein
MIPKSMSFYLIGLHNRQAAGLEEVSTESGSDLVNGPSQESIRNIAW